jgi:hypothetical protein
MLLGVTAMPTGFSVDNSPQRDDPTKLCGHPAIETVYPHTGKADVQFLGGQIGPAIGEGLTSYANAGIAKKAIQKAREFSSCTTFDETDKSGTATHWTLGELSFPKLGDDQIALRMSGTFDAGLGTVDLVIFRQGRVIVLVAGVSVTTILGGGQLQPGQVEAAARAAAKKVEAET